MSVRIDFSVNGKAVSVSPANEETPLLAILRGVLGLMGTRFGCGLEQCGCCMVLIDGQPEKSCAKPIWAVAGKQVVTVEALIDRNPQPTRAEIAEALDGNICRCGSHNRILRAVEKAAAAMRAGASA